MIYSVIGGLAGILIPPLVCRMFNIEVRYSSNIVMLPGPGLYIWMIGLSVMTAIGFVLDMVK